MRSEHILLDSMRKKSWINLAKTCAGVGVILQHVNGYCYTDQRIFYSVWWVVALFVMIGGYNVMGSYLNRGEILVKRRLMNIFLPYLLATALYTVMECRFLDIADFLKRLVHFDASGPLYYVAVYMQLVLVTPFLIGTLNWIDEKNQGLRGSVVLVLIFCVCYGTVHFTNVFDIAIGGGNLFAGVWLLFWTLGMFIRKFEVSVTGKRLKICLFFSNTIALLLWEYLFVFRSWNLKLLPMFHGTEVRMTWANALETILLFFWFREATDGFEKVSGKIGKGMLQLVNYMGEHTLYIFLYHMMFLSIYKHFFEFGNQMINAGACIAFMLVGPLLLERVISIIKKGASGMMGSISVR